MAGRTCSCDTSIKLTLVGVALSIVLIGALYWIATAEILQGLSLIIGVVCLSCIQAVVQLICFFHLGMEKAPHWNLITFLFTVLVIVVVVGGSLWIMYNLDYNMMPNMKH